MQFRRNIIINDCLLSLHRSKMGSSESKAPEVSTPPSPASGTPEKPKCKACCACPETKKVRDAW